MSIAVQTIGGPVEENNAGFSHEEIYVAPVSLFTSIAAPGDLATAVSLSELVTIAQDHTFDIADGFTTIKAIAESVSFNGAQIGEASMSPVRENKLTLKMVGSKADLLGFDRWVKGKDVIVLAKEASSGNIRQIGSASYAGKLLESSEVIEGPIEGENSVTMVFGDKQKYYAPIYTGTVTKQP